MRVALNGWFWDQPTVGSGQYLHHLVEHLPRAAPAHTYYLVVPADDLPVGAAPRGRPGAGESVGGEHTGSPLPHPVSLPFGRERPRLRKLFFEQVAFPRACRALGADMAHVPYWGSPLFAPCPVVVTIHDLIPVVLPAYRSRWTMRWYIRLVSVSARRAAAVIAVSQATARDVARHLGIPPERIHVIYEGAPSACRPITDPALLEAVRRKYALPDRFFLYIGGFDVRKNVSVLLSSYARLLASGMSGLPPLVIAGSLPDADTPFMPDPRAGAARLGLSGRVHFPGRIDEADKPALYSSATVLVYPSRFEGFGLPPLEAMACGCPVITADATSLPEVVGNAAILVPPDDEEGWATAMRRLLDGGERELWRQKGMAQAARFDWLRAAQETALLYAGIASSHLAGRE
jgi:glycosyltransferase involved in cell wall biosynthesis